MITTPGILPQYFGGWRWGGGSKRQVYGQAIQKMQSRQLLGLRVSAVAHFNRQDT